MRIAFCESHALTPQRDALSRAEHDVILALRALGHQVRTFIADDGDVVDGVRDFGAELVIVARPGLFFRTRSRLRELGVPLVFFAGDLEFVRLGLQEKFDPRLRPGVAAMMRTIEERCFLDADLVLLPTEDEAVRGMAEFPGARCRAVNYYAFPERALPAGPPPRLDPVFVGPASHVPNWDGIRWFLGEVWAPAASARRDGAELQVVGEWGAGSFVAAGAQFHGRLSDEELDRVLSGAGVGIAPLRFGAGMKRKTVHYLSHGLPVIGTDYAVEGLGDETPGVIRATTADEWREALQRVADPAEWRRLSRDGAAFVSERFSAARQRDDLAGAVRAATDIAAERSAGPRPFAVIDESTSRASQWGQGSPARPELLGSGDAR